MAGASGVGVEVSALPAVGLDAHPWPETGTSLISLPPEALTRLLAAVPVRWRSLYGLPLWGGGELRGALVVATASGHPPGVAEAEVLKALGEALGPELVQRQEDAALRAGLLAREEALAVVAHDLRNPLHAISVGVSTLLPRISEPSLRRPVERIQRSAHRMERLLQDLLDIHAIEGGRFTVTRGEIAPTALILTALESQQNLAGQTSVIINTDVAPEIPPIAADEERVLQVLENLVGNALKFTPPGGVVTVGGTRAADPGWVLFSVRDTGPGIAAEHLPHIFDRFWQARPRTGAGPGWASPSARPSSRRTGAGSGRRASPEKGATFFFTLPAASEKEPRHAGAVEPASILLVDDRPENLIALEAILDRPDYRLVTATSGEEALRLALRERFAVALIDVAMPRMNGFEVADAPEGARAQPPHPDHLHHRLR